MTESPSEEFLYVNDFDNTVETWAEYGAEPWLDSIETANRIEGLASVIEAYFTFLNTTKSAEWLKEVKLQIYCKKVAGSESQYVLIYVDNGVDEEYLAGAIGVPNTDYAWKESLLPGVDTWAKVNALKIKLGRSTSGFHLETFWVNSFTNDWNGWDKTGNLPYLGDNDDEVSTKNDGDQTGYYGFEDVPYYHFVSTVLYTYAKGDGNDTIQIDVYDGTTWHNNVKTYAPGADYAWEATTISGIINSQEKVNALQVRFTYFKSGKGNVLYVRKCKIETYVSEPTLVTVACARLANYYYEDAEEQIKFPTDNEIETPGWTDPNNAMEESGYATGATPGAKQNYLNHDFANIAAVYEVWIFGKDMKSDTGLPDAIRYCISPDGGITWYYKSFIGAFPNPTERECDFTAEHNWIPTTLNNTNLKTRLWAGSSGCFTGDCEIPLWLANTVNRKAMRDSPDAIRLEILWKLFKSGKIKIKTMPKVLAFENQKFCEGRITGIKRHLNRQCYYIVCKRAMPDGDWIKDTKVSATQPVHEFFKGKITAEELEIGDIIGGLFWDDKKEDYVIYGMEIIEKTDIGLRTVYQLLVDKECIFAHAFMKVFVKW